MYITNGNWKIANEMGGYYTRIGSSIGSIVGLAYGSTEDAKQYIKKPYFQAELENYMLTMQKGKMDCPVALSKSANKFFGRDMSYIELAMLREGLLEENQDVSLLDYLNNTGLNAQQIPTFNKSNYMNAGEYLVNQKLLYISINIPNQSENHFIAIQKIWQWNKDGVVKVRIADPALGMRTMTWNELIKIQEYSYLINGLK